MSKKVQHAAAAPADAPEEPVKVWTFFVAFGIVLLLIIGITVYNSYQRDRERAENQYNGFDFAEAAGGLWVTRIEVGQQPYDIPFYYHPRETEEVIIDRTATDPILRGAPRQIYISVAPDAGAQVVVAGVEISRITGAKYNLLNIDTKGALSSPAPGKLDVPVVSCANATPDVVVVQFVEGRDNLIARSQNPNCIILQYTDTNESVRVADRFAYMLLRIM